MNDISFVLGVYNGLNLTKKAYENLKKNYPKTPLVISSGGSTDGTKEWLESLNDDYLSYFHDDDRLTLSDTYNAGIKLVDTEKLVLIHNDMIIGKYFLENIEKILTEDMVLNYTMIEPPIFGKHYKPGKVIKDFGTDFDNFNEAKFYEFEEKHKDNNIQEKGASFFIAGYKKMFEDVGYFDGFSFNPAFCEDDDFVIRAKIKGYNLIAIYNAMVYHFVSKTSRFSEEYKIKSKEYEKNSLLNFIRKWGISPHVFNLLRYWEDEKFEYNFFKMGLETNNLKVIQDLEPFFDKIKINKLPKVLIKNIQETTNYNIESKFNFVDEVDVLVIIDGDITTEDYDVLSKLRLSIPHYEPGEYVINNMKIIINNKINDDK